MSTSFDLPDLDHFITGTIGEPGSRVFYLQAVAQGQVFTLRLEKIQVATLAEVIAGILSDMPAPAVEETATNIELIEPAIAEWVVGRLGVAHDETTNRIIVVAREIPDPAESDPDAPDPDVADPDAAEEGATASFSLTPAQAMAFVRQAGRTVAAGRPACMLCARPMDPEGHVCIKTNGHKPH